MTYDNPENYTSSEERRKEMLKKAIQYMDKKNSDTEEMTSEDIVEAAKNFDDFVSD